MGSPDFAVPILKKLAENYTVCGVVTQPDRPAGRGNLITPPPVKAAAMDLELPIIQPVRLREPGVFERLQEWGADVIIVAAFGQILRQNVLDLPKYGCVNVHASLLPRWRGAAPIQAAILAGDAVSGVSLMRMDAGIDTGPVYMQEQLEIEPDDTTLTLRDRLAEAGANLLVQSLPKIITGELAAKPQDDSTATYAPKVGKEQALLDFNLPARQLERRVRAFTPWPGTYFSIDGQNIKVTKAKARSAKTANAGCRTIDGGFPSIGTVEGELILLEVQPAGKKAMRGDVFLNGFRNWLSK